MIGSIWASPWTCLGALLARAGGCARAGTIDKAVAYVAPRRGPWAWFFAKGWAAIAFGESIIFADAAHLGNVRLLRHELRHVMQYRILGPLFPLVYGLGSAWAWIRGGHHYRDNFLERDARNAAE